MFYSSLTGNYDDLTFGQVTASYTLYPLCVIIFIIALFLALYPECENKKVLGIKINNLNIFFKYSTCIIGILGCSIYFILPSVFILLGDFITLICYIGSSLYIKTHSKSKKESTKELNPVLTKKSKKDDKVTSTKIEIAIHLINKNASMDFIQDITGLSPECLQKLKEEALSSNVKK